MNSLPVSVDESAFEARLDAAPQCRLAGTVFTSGCPGWYHTDADKVFFSGWPGAHIAHARATGGIDLTAYETGRRAKLA